MTDHRIRLRRGWELLNPGDSSAPRILALPLTEFPEWPAPRQRLGRWFNAPPYDPIRETLWLQLTAVTGLLSIRVNDREIAASPFPEEPFTFSLADRLQNRNQLILDVDLAATGRPVSNFFWGDIALLIQPRDSD